MNFNEILINFIFNCIISSARGTSSYLFFETMLTSSYKSKCMIFTNFKYVSTNKKFWCWVETNN